jgi:hypothetical protein
MEAMMAGRVCAPGEPGRDDPVPRQRAGSSESKERRQTGPLAALEANVENPLDEAVGNTNRLREQSHPEQRLRAHYAAKIPLGDFTRFIGTSYEPWILPVLPVGATLKLHEDGTTIDPANCGKIPGKFIRSAGGWVGFAGWQTHWTNKFDLERWQEWQTPELPVPVCMRLDEHPVVDLDVNRADDLAELLSMLATEVGPAPARTRPNSTRRALIYKWEPGTPPVRKRSFRWLDDKGENLAIDILGLGCHTLIEGRHKSGVEHEWPAGDLLAWEGKLTPASAGTMSRFLSMVRLWVELKPGYRLLKASLPGAGHHDLDGISTDDPAILIPLAAEPEAGGHR